MDAPYGRNGGIFHKSFIKNALDHRLQGSQYHSDYNFNTVPLSPLNPRSPSAISII